MILQDLTMLLVGAFVTAVGALAAGDARAAPAAGMRIDYCHGYGCAFRSPVVFSQADLAALGRLMAAGSRSAAAERVALVRASQWYERKAGAETGTSGDVAKDMVTLFTPPGQIDCVDEARNTDALLRMIARRGWLRHHDVGPIVSRGALVDLRWPHHTATIRDRGTGEAWVVDSWVRANAEPPDVKKLSVWQGEGGLRPAAAAR